MIPSEETRTRNTETRRRLVKSAVAAPMVFTLPMGASLAAESVSCVDKIDSTDAALLVGSADLADDLWVRVQLPLKRFVLKNSGASCGGTPPNVTGFDYDGKWYTYTVGESAAIPVPSDKRVCNPVAKTTSPTTVYALVDVSFDPMALSGPIRVSQVDDPITPVPGASCWNSVNPNPIDQIGGNVINP
jgi:hypothetical protein